MAEAEKPAYRRAVRSYILRPGRITPGQRRAIEYLYPRYGLGSTARLDFAAIFGNDRPVTVEIGFGNGAALVEMARRAPEVNFIGIEVHPPGVGRLLLQLEESGITNVRVLRADAVAVVQNCMADASVADFCLFFPDPWPKKKHHKRRLLQPDFTALLAAKLKTGGRLHFATDWEDYAWQALECLDRCSHLSNINGVGQFAARPESRPLTRFERRGQLLGHRVFDLIAEKINPGETLNKSS